jgi:hypothetical protein
MPIGPRRPVQISERTARRRRDSTSAAIPTSNPDKIASAPGITQPLHRGNRHREAALESTRWPTTTPLASWDTMRRIVETCSTTLAAPRQRPLRVRAGGHSRSSQRSPQRRHREPGAVPYQRDDRRARHWRLGGAGATASPTGRTPAVPRGTRQYSPAPLRLGR